MSMTKAICKSKALKTNGRDSERMFDRALICTRAFESSRRLALQELSIRVLDCCRDFIASLSRDRITFPLYSPRTDRVEPL
jgi:hypothetical protein